MSNNNKSTGTAREYVESIVQDQNVEELLAKQQPRYDPQKHQQQPALDSFSASKQSQEEEQSSESTKYNIHRPTINPIPSNHDDAKNNDKQHTNVVWAVRDFLDQKREIHETALDNCADLHADLLSCFKHGSWWDKAKMCEDQKQKFWNCYKKQKVTIIIRSLCVCVDRENSRLFIKEFLKANNYKGPVSTPEQDAHVLQQAILLSSEENTSV